MPGEYVYLTLDGVAIEGTFTVRSYFSVGDLLWLQWLNDGDRHLYRRRPGDGYVRYCVNAREGNRLFLINTHPTIGRFAAERTKRQWAAFWQLQAQDIRTLAYILGFEWNGPDNNDALIAHAKRVAERAGVSREG